MGNERTLVTCQSCDARCSSQRFTRDQCPLISRCKRKIAIYSVLQSVFLCLSDEKTLQKRKNQCQFFRHVTSVFYWKIFATVFICFIAGECHGRVNIVVWISDLFKIVENCEVKAFGDFHVGLRPVLHFIFYFLCRIYFCEMYNSKCFFTNRSLIQITTKF